MAGLALNEEPLRICVIGCGQIAEAHFAAIKALEPKVQLMYTVDVDAKRAQTAAAKYGAHRWSTDYHEAFADASVEAAILCLPHHLHASITIAAIKEGVHVLCEKPMALNATEAESMLDAARSAKVRLMVGHTRRFTSASMSARELVSSGDLGQIRHVSSLYLSYIEKPTTEWRYSSKTTGGFMIPIFGTHLIDLLTWITGLSVDSVYCETSASSVWEGEDEVAIVLSLKGAEGGNIPATIHMSAHCRIGRDELIVAGVNKTILVSRNDLYIDGKLASTNGTNNRFETQLHEFVRSVKENREPISSGAEAYQIMRVLDACHRSAQCHEPIHLHT